MAIIAEQMKLEKSDNQASDGTFAAVGCFKNLTLPSITRESIDVTNLCSEGGFREYIPGLRDGGEVSGTISFVPSAAINQTWLDDVDSGTVQYYKVTFPDQTTTWEFTAIPLSFVPSADIGAELTAEITMKVTGKPTFTTV